MLPTIKHGSIKDHPHAKEIQEKLSQLSVAKIIEENGGFKAGNKIRKAYDKYGQLRKDISATITLDNGEVYRISEIPLQFSIVIRFNKITKTNNVFIIYDTLGSGSFGIVKRALLPNEDMLNTSYQQMAALKRFAAHVRKKRKKNGVNPLSPLRPWELIALQKEALITQLLALEMPDDAAEIAELERLLGLINDIQNANIYSGEKYDEILRYSVLDDYGTMYAPLIKGQELEKVLTSNKKPPSNEELDLKDKLALLSTLLDAGIALHTKKAAHLDIKPANVMVERLADGSWKARFIDCGFANYGNIGERLKWIRNCSPLYAAPECMPHVSSGPASEGYIDDYQKADVYTIGKTLYEIFMGLNSFPEVNTIDRLIAFNENPDEYLRRIGYRINGRTPTFKEYFAQQFAAKYGNDPLVTLIGEELFALYTGLTQFDPKKRLDLSAAKTSIKNLLNRLDQVSQFANELRTYLEKHYGSEILANLDIPNSTPPITYAQLLDQLTKNNNSMPWLLNNHTLLLQAQKGLRELPKLALQQATKNLKEELKKYQNSSFIKNLQVPNIDPPITYGELLTSLAQYDIQSSVYTNRDFRYFVQIQASFKAQLVNYVCQHIEHNQSIDGINAVEWAEGHHISLPENKTPREWAVNHQKEALDNLLISHNISLKKNEEVLSSENIDKMLKILSEQAPYLNYIQEEVNDLAAKLLRLQDAKETRQNSSIPNLVLGCLNILKKITPKFVKIQLEAKKVIDSDLNTTLRLN